MGHLPNHVYLVCLYLPGQEELPVTDKVPLLFTQLVKGDAGYSHTLQLILLFNHH